MSDDDPTRVAQARDRTNGAYGRLPEGFVLHHTYEIVRRIGGGGMGDVYEAKHLLSQDRYAIKVIRDDLVDDERIRSMFIRESDILKRIRHDAVVNYGGLLQDEQGRGFLVMDYIDGPSLRERLRERPLSVDEAKRLLRQVARGLAEVHAAGTFHRDLSPDNILLPDGDLDRAVIIDFGIAKLSEPDAATFVGTDIAGKYGYISPEQLGVIEKPVDARSEIYSLGLVVAAAMRGKSLDMGANWATVVEARKSVPKLDGIPKPMRRLLSKMLAPNPDDRPADMEALLALVGEKRVQKRDRASATRSVQSSGSSAKEQSGATRGIAIAVIVLLAMAGLGFAGYRFAMSPPELMVEGVVDEIPTMDPATETAVPAGQMGEMYLPEQLIAETSAEAGLPYQLQAPMRSTIDTATLRAIIEETPCAALDISVNERGIVTLRGEVASLESQVALARDIQSVPGVAELQNNLVINPQPACEAISLASAFGRPSLLPMQFNQADSVYHEGDYLVILVNNSTGGDRHVQVDFFDPSGDVYHLRPNPIQDETLMPRDAVVQVGVGPADVSEHVRHYRLGAPYGQATILAIASEEPLFATARPEAEPAQTYVNALGEALARQSEAQLVSNWQTLEIAP